MLNSDYMSKLDLH